MAAQLKDRYGREVPERIAAMLSAGPPGFDRAAFFAALDGYDGMELMDRGRLMGRALAAALPADYPRALEVLLASLGPPLKGGTGNGMAPFLYLPHTVFVATHGLDHFEPSMAALHALTQRFTAEFAIRPFLERHPERTLERLHAWCADESQHVRRLVSEGTRPRLPWAPRLRAFQEDPAPVLALLEKLADDPEEYVRRSVANNLNDIGKDHPELLAEVAADWLARRPGRRRVVAHGLRTALKRGEPGALRVLGLEGADGVEVADAAPLPDRVAVGGSVRVAVTLANRGAVRRRVMADLAVYFVKADGSARPKVFKMRVLELEPGGTGQAAATVSLREMTTRRLYPGRHRLEVLLNGRAVPLGSFELVPGDAG